jgi:hypothetical protein
MTPEQRDTPPETSPAPASDRAPIYPRAGERVAVTRRDVPDGAECYLEVAADGVSARMLLTLDHAQAIAERLTIPF